MVFFVRDVGGVAIGPDRGFYEADSRESVTARARADALPQHGDLVVSVLPGTLRQWILRYLQIDIVAARHRADRAATLARHFKDAQENATSAAARVAELEAEFAAREATSDGRLPQPEQQASPAE